MSAVRTFLALFVCIQLLSAQLGWLTKKDYFVPATSLSGIGLARADISDTILARRTEFMIDAQTFSIMREAQALHRHAMKNAPSSGPAWLLIPVFTEDSRRLRAVRAGPASRRSVFRAGGSVP